MHPYWGLGMLFPLVDSSVTSKVALVFSLRLLLLRLVFLCTVPGWVPFPCQAEEEASPTPSPGLSEETIVPTFETQKLARTYILDIPAPRGQITDRNGAPLAQNRLSYNLAINYPTPLDFSDAQLLSFAREKIQAAEKLLGRPLRISDELIKRHYRNRGILPFEIAQNLTTVEYDESKGRLPAGMILRPYYVRTYPNGRAAGQVIGYSGKTGRNPDGIIDNHEVLWPETEGREGLEQTFNQVLTGKHGEYKITFDQDGRKTSEKIVKPPIPGHTVVTTLDLHLQELAEKALEAKAKRGAIVVVDPNNGDILAMASGRPTIRTRSRPRFPPRNSRPCRTIRTFRFCRARSALLSPRLNLQSCGRDCRFGNGNRACQ